MSWEAVRWAMNQDPGSAIDKLVLIATCNFANKRTGKIFATAETIADWCNINHRFTVRKSQRRLCADGFLIDTGERSGGNGRVPVFEPGWDKETQDKLHPPHGASFSELSPNYVRTKSGLSARDASSFIAKAGLNPEPVTSNTDDDTKALGNSIAGGKSKAVKSSSSNLDFLHHPKYPEFERYCKSRDGSPTKKGFETWLCQQAPERPKPKRKQTAKPQPKGWLEWLEATYPSARVRDYWKVSSDVQREFEASR